QKPVAKGVQSAALAEKTEGFSGADIAAVARKAAMMAVRRAVKTMEKAETGDPDILIRRQDIDDALEEVRRGMG
ncbi:MAG: hypothetical protein AABZ85_04475, partial [Thermodesulfobacteriota bacterium]